MRGIGAPLTKLAIFTAVTIVSVLLLLAAVQNEYFASVSDYKAKFTDASGLIAGSEVRIAGVRVGQVSDVQVVDRNVAEVSFTVDEGRRLPTSAIFAIRYQNLVGQRFLEISRGQGATTAMLQPGATIPTSQTRPPLDLTVVFNGFKPLFQALSPNDINQLSFEIIQVLQGEGGNIRNLLARTASLTQTIAERDQVIGSLIDNLNTTLDTVNARDENLSGLIVSLQQLVSGLAADRTAIGQTLAPIADLTDTTAGLLSDIRPPLAEDIVRLGQQGEILSRNRGLIENFLRYVPQKANNIGKAGTYGSWFNFYLCNLGLKITGLPQLPDTTIPGLPAEVSNGAFELQLPADSGGRCSGTGGGFDTAGAGVGAPPGATTGAGN